MTKGDKNDQYSIGDYRTYFRSQPAPDLERENAVLKGQRRGTGSPGVELLRDLFSCRNRPTNEGRNDAERQRDYKRATQSYGLPYSFREPLWH